MTDIAALDAQIAALEAEADRALDLATVEQAARSEAHGITIPPDFRLRTCAEWRAIQPQLKALRDQRASAIPTPPTRPAPLARTPVPSIDMRSREDKIRAIAAGLPVPIPAEMVEAAIANGQSVEGFAVAAAAFSARETELDALVAGIVAFVPTAESQPVDRDSEEQTADELAADIARHAPARKT